MKKILIFSTLFSFCSLTYATTINAPASLVGANKLVGEDAYAWGISLNLGSGQQIASAEIDWNNVTLTGANSSGTGRLYTDLLADSKTGVTTYIDNDAAGDYFLTTGSGFTSATMQSIGSQYFSKVGVTQSTNYVLTATQLALLNTFVGGTNSNFAIGIDPDCHYTVGGLSFTYTLSTTPTSPSGQPVPDGAPTALLMLTGLSVVEIFRRKWVAAT